MSATLIRRRATAVDVMLLLEGTYPFVSGGVSSWVAQILAGFPRLSFAVIFLGSRRQDYGEIKYTLPDNVTHFQSHFLFDDMAPARPAATQGDAAVFERIARMHENMRTPRSRAAGAVMMGEYTADLGNKLPFEDFLYSKRAWEFIRAQFEQGSTDPSFVDYFWTVRSMHAPIWRLASIRDGLPKASVLHTISTGYAGLLGVMAKKKLGRPLILSEHGIYTKERRIELAAAQWIADNRSVLEREPTEVGYLRGLWTRFFESIGRSCYHASDHIISLYEANRQRQIADGAPPDRTRCIANGIDLERFENARANRPAEVPKVLCLVGRVVAIKDIKTFIRAMRTVVNRLPEAVGWIAGPLDEEPGYVEECLGLVDALGVTEAVKFLGPQDLERLFPRIGVLALSSISEALPLAVLEAFAAGVPAVCTDVGACRTLIEGGSTADRALGSAGTLVRMGDPQALADAALHLLTDTAARARAAEAGLRRVESFYAESTMLTGYRELYQRSLRVGYAGTSTTSG